MKITREQFGLIEDMLPTQRGNVRIDNYTFVSAILYIAENGCKWRALPKEYGKWDTIYKRCERWVKNGVMERVFIALQHKKIISIKIEVLSVDSTSIKLHPDAHGALKKQESKPLGSQKVAGIPSFMWYPQMMKSSLKCTSLAANVTMGPKVANP